MTLHKGNGHGHVTYFKLRPNVYIFGMAEAMHWYTHWLCTLLEFGLKIYPQRDVAWVPSRF